MSGPITMRNCPMCDEAPKPDSGDGVILTVENVIDLSDRSEAYDVGYTARCCNCGCSVSAEYLDEVVRLWNGEPEPTDDEVMN